MPKRQPHTPKSQIKSALHKLFLRSRERQAVLKAAGYACSCGKKQSKAKGREISVEVHHINGIDWDKVYDFIYKQLLPSDGLEVVCLECHDERHGKGQHNGEEINSATD